MKKNYWLLLLMTTLCLTFTACGDDDDESGNGTVKTCQLQVDGRTANFQYAYFSVESESRGRYSYLLEFYTIDMDYYVKHPYELIGKKMSNVTIAFSSPNRYDVSSLPTGSFTFNNYPNDGEHFEDCEIQIDASYSSGDDYQGQIYCADWTPGYASSDLIINKAANGQYTIEINNLKLLAGEPNDDGAGTNSRKTNGSFYFEGTFQDTTSWEIDWD